MDYLGKTFPWLNDDDHSSLPPPMPYSHCYSLQTMDPITELDVLHRLTEALEENPKRDFLELVFPADNRNTYDLMCKLVSYSISMKYQTTLRKCSRYFKVKVHIIG